MNQIRVGLIGFGDWAKTAYVPILKSFKEVDIVSVCARSDATQVAARKVLGDEFKWYTNYEDLVADKDVDVVMIGLPFDTTASAAVATLKANKHVFIEPPLPSGDVTEELFNLAGETDKVVHFDLGTRYLAVVEIAKQAMNEEEFGDIQNITLSVENNWGNVPSDSELKDGLRHIVFGLSPWYLDLCEYFIPQVPVSVEIIGAQNKVGLANLQYPKCGATWKFNLHVRTDHQCYITVVGKYGEVRVNLTNGEYAWTNRSGSSEGNAPAKQPDGAVGSMESVVAFLLATQNGERTKSDPISYQRIHSMMVGLEESYHQNKRVLL